MTKLFNSEFEISLRILLLLSEVDNSGITIDRIVAYDFITIYNKYFEISEINLNGDNNFGFAEIASRRIHIQNSLKTLVLDKLISVLRKEDGFRYCINADGRKFSQQLTTDYALMYRAMAKKTIKAFNNKSDVVILSLISKKSTEALRR